ncbi:mannitol dehydrogenase family protein [Sinomonas mesophila]|uniref:mannitol dehydrogenase family protein n=1 Tax=Sinomonas mesophila TaxID=1531955 RepID=UPI00098706C1|nr:mannitol dehydrogenase family protein [Sinomonas mesophila]
MERLSYASLARTSGPQPRFGPGEVTPGIVHLGVGSFHRAHTAVFTEDAMAATGEHAWGTVGVTQRSDAVVRQLAPQDCLFTLSERGDGAAPLRVVSGITGMLAGRAEPGAVVARIADPGIHVVTLTVTEKGYRIDPLTGGLGLDDPEVRADLAGAPPVTAIGQLARGLEARHRASDAPLTVVPCDNLPGNGALTRRLVRAFVEALPAGAAPGLADWIASSVAFPSTMVDRMAPATTPADLDAVERALGLRDEAAVVAEPFRQWVIEDAFAGPRPAWEAAGAVLTDDVEPWETAKLRILNAGHSLLAYLGLAAGHATIAEAVHDEAFEAACQGLIGEEVLPTAVLPDGLDGEDYARSVVARFANPALGHTTAKVGSDGSQKLGLRILPTAAACLAVGREPRWAALAVAAWMHHVATASAAGGALADPLAGTLAAALRDRPARASAVDALLALPEVVDPALAADPRFGGPVRHWYELLDAHGATGLRREILHG